MGYRKTGETQDMNIKDFTYNELSFMAFGEAQAVKKDIDALIYENDQLKDVLHEQAQEIAEMKGEIEVI
jgi:hypothetical protein